MIKKILLFIILTSLSHQSFPMSTKHLSKIETLNDVHTYFVINKEEIKLAIEKNLGNYKTDPLSFIKDVKKLISNSPSKTGTKIVKSEGIIILLATLFSLFKLKKPIINLEDKFFITMSISTIIGIMFCLFLIIENFTKDLFIKKITKEKISNIFMILFENYSIEEVAINLDSPINTRELLPKKLIPAFDYLYKKINDIGDITEQFEILTKENLHETYRIINDYINQAEKAIKKGFYWEY